MERLRRSESSTSRILTSVGIPIYAKVTRGGYWPRKPENTIHQACRRPDWHPRHYQKITPLPARLLPARHVTVMCHLIKLRHEQNNSAYRPPPSVSQGESKVLL